MRRKKMYDDRSIAMTLLSCSDNNLGTDTERISHSRTKSERDTNLYENELMEKTTL